MWEKKNAPKHTPKKLNEETWDFIKKYPYIIRTQKLSRDTRESHLVSIKVNHKTVELLGMVPDLTLCSFGLKELINGKYIYSQNIVDFLLARYTMYTNFTCSQIDDITGI